MPLKDYQLIIRSSFSDNHTPPSFTQTSAKLSALSKNRLTQHTVKRSVVFLLGFGLNMGVDDVNMFLTKVLQERKINPKDPFEVICWYCYSKRFSYLKFEELWNIYNDTPAGLINLRAVNGDETVSQMNIVRSIKNDDDLMAYLSQLKAGKGVSAMSVTAKRCFDELYNEARKLIAKLYNSYEEEKHSEEVREYVDKLSRNDRLYDYEKQARIERFRAEKKVFDRDEITESDIEHIICSAIPTDRHGNLTPAKASKLNEQFARKRFSRQRIGEIISGRSQVTRFDLITLNFFIFSQKTDEYPNARAIYSKFCDSTNEILEKCFMGELYIQNPYECFVLMCILSNEPPGTYADVWELSYEP